MRASIAIMAGCLALAAGLAAEDKKVDLFSTGELTFTHCDATQVSPGTLRVTYWRGYRATGFETARLPFQDFSSWKSLRFDVENPYPEPLSVFLRLSDRTDHPKNHTYTGGTFDGYVVGPGRSTVQISLEKMLSPEQLPVDARRVAWLGIYFQPLFLRDGLELVFPSDKKLVLSNLRLSRDAAALQKQPYADPLFRETVPALGSLREETERAVAELSAEIEKARGAGVETAYAEVYPYLAQVAFRSKLVAFWQDRAAEQRRALEFLLHGAQAAKEELIAVAQKRAPSRAVPAVPAYGDLEARDRYFRHGADPVLLFGMLYNTGGVLARWFANSQTDYGTQLVAGGTRHNVEKQPIWEAYRKYPDTHRVGWSGGSGHLIRDSSSWEVVGPPVMICLESPHTREAISAMIEPFERQHAGDRSHLVQNMGYEYTYVCYCEETRRMWAQWLERKYGTVAKANGIWKTAFKQFRDAPMPRPEQAGENRALWFDWASFNLYRFLDRLQWTAGEVRRWEQRKPLTVGSPYYAFDPGFWTGVDEEELADSGIVGVTLEENYALDTLMPEYLHALAGSKPVADFEYHGVIHQILPSFLHGDAAISMWWWNDRKSWTPNEPINEWTTSFPQSYTIPLSDVAKAMRDALDLRRLGREIAALGSAPRPVVLLYSKSSMLQQVPAKSAQTGSFPYLSSLRRIYNASQPAGLYVGLTTEKKILAGDLGSRRVLVLPGANFVPAPVVDATLKWVEAGGTLVVSPDSLLADEYARPASTLEKLGLELLRTEPAPLKHGETLVTEYNLSELPRKPFTLEGARFEAVGARQVLRAPDSAVAARFADGIPAVVSLKRGRGRIYWLSSELTASSWRRFLLVTGREAGLDPGLQVAAEPGTSAEQVEYRVAGLDGRRLAYLYNDSDRDARLTLTPAFAAREIVDLRRGTKLPARRLNLPARETAIVELQ